MKKLFILITLVCMLIACSNPDNINIDTPVDTCTQDSGEWVFVCCGAPVDTIVFLDSADIGLK